MADPKDPDQLEHAKLFTEDEPAEKRYEPVEVDLSQPERKDGESRASDAGVDELQRQLDEQRGRTSQAEAAAREAAQRAEFAERRAMGASVSMIDSAIEAAERASAQAQAKFQASLDSADHRGAAQAQTELSDARHNLLRLQEQKAMVEAEAQRPPPTRHPAQPQMQFDGAAIMQGLARDGFPRSAQWLQNRPELLNPQQMRKVASAHNHLVDNYGYVPETDEYFAALEREIYRPSPQRQTPANGAARRPTAAAPVNSNAVSLRTGETKRSHVPLTAAQREAAELSGMTDREYAESYEDARTKGKLMGTVR